MGRTQSLGAMTVSGGRVWQPEIAPEERWQAHPVKSCVGIARCHEDRTVGLDLAERRCSR
eukprot:5845224-Pyramimonas_sp.AAC.1